MGGERTERIRMEVPSHLRYGEAARSMLNTLSRRLEKETETPDLAAHVISAFSEAFNNAVNHAYRGDPNGNVEIEIGISPSHLLLSLADEGEGFDIEAVEAPDLSAMPEGGLGLWIMRSCMTRVEYTRAAKNTIIMEKDFAQPLTLGSDHQEDV